jgi:hypothetical protein
MSSFRESRFSVLIVKILFSQTRAGVRAVIVETLHPEAEDRVRRYSKTRVAVPRGNVLKWLFSKKATSHTLKKGVFTLVLLYSGYMLEPGETAYARI